jgi:hypothetical protein
MEWVEGTHEQVIIIITCVCWNRKKTRNFKKLGTAQNATVCRQEAIGKGLDDFVRSYLMLFKLSVLSVTPVMFCGHYEQVRSDDAIFCT